jgi:hypothetical protein
MPDAEAGDDYKVFLSRKLVRAEPVGFEPSSDVFGLEALFPFQRALVQWCCRRGRAALFADTGLGKTRMQLAWAEQVVHETGGSVLILAPLAVAAQTVREGAAMGITVAHLRTAEDVASLEEPIAVINYDRLHLIDSMCFAGVVLDESSCLKDYTSATRNALIEAFARTPYKLACTATPAPNDHIELGNHAEFLGIMSRTEMLSQWFVHDGGSTQDWRIKGHAVESFWRWVASWAALVRRPSDLGYDDGAYALPPLEVHEHVVAADLATAHAAGKLFVEPAQTLDEQRKARRASLADRVARAAELIMAEPGEPWVVWCELNDEADALEEAIGDAVQIAGSHKIEVKEHCLNEFATGRLRVLISKPSICGWGLNWQHCARVAFVGIGHSFEAYYQAVRRCWRFGQTRPVIVHIVTSEAEGAVVANLRRKQSDAQRMADEMRVHVAAHVRAAVGGTARETTPYEPRKALALPSWLRSVA